MRRPGPPGATWRAVPVPSVAEQSIGFMIGSVLFAIGSAPGVSAWAGAPVANICFFVGAWFFSAAALIQLHLSGPRTTDGLRGRGPMLRAEWVAAATQFFGALLFNVSTTFALHATSTVEHRDLVWSPDAGGSAAFLISGTVALIAGTRSRERGRAAAVERWADRVNLLGCVAFGVSAVGAFVSTAGVTTDPSLATFGTFVGAVCFFTASAMVLPDALGRRG